MGEKLLKEYERANQLGGLKARMRLAVLTQMPSPKATTEPDSPENLAKFEAALKELTKEFNK